MAPLHLLSIPYASWVLPSGVQVSKAYIQHRHICVSISPFSFFMWGFRVTASLHFEEIKSICSFSSLISRNQTLLPHLVWILQSISYLFSLSNYPVPTHAVTSASPQHCPLPTSPRSSLWSDHHHPPVARTMFHLLSSAVLAILSCSFLSGQ